MTKILAYFAIILYNTFFGWMTENTPWENQLRILSFVGDIGMMVMALSSLRKGLGFYGKRMFVVFLLVSTFTLIYNFDRTGLVVHLNGLRLPFFFFTTFIVTYDILQSEHEGAFQKWFTWFFVVFALAQIPTSFDQFRKHGPSDFVGGTLGWGGCNVITLALFLIVFYLILKYGSSDDKEHFGIPQIAFFSILLFPCAINETKISFILLPVMILLLTVTKRVYVAIPVLFLGVVFFYIFNWLYSEYQRDTVKLLDLSYLEEYLLFTDRTNSDVPRAEKLLLTFDLMARDPATFFVGLGYGLFMGSHLLKGTAFSFSYQWLSGTRMFLNTVWLEGGLLAVVCIAYTLFHFVASKQVVSPNMKRFKWFLFFVLFSMWLYHDSLYARAFAAIASYLVLWTERGGLDRSATEEFDEVGSDDPVEAVVGRTG